MIPVRKDAYQLFHDGSLALARAEHYGMKVDLKLLKRQIEKMEIRIARAEKRLKKSKIMKMGVKYLGHDFNINSGKQLRELLYDHLDYTPTKFTASDKGSTDIEALSKLNIPELEDYLYINKCTKVRDTYLNNYLYEQIDGIIHASYNLHNIITFRSSCSNPNFQNIPKRDPWIANICRSVFIPREGCQLAEIDFKSMEVSISACYHKDPKMIDYLITPGTDMHRDVAQQIFFKNHIDGSIKEEKELRFVTKNDFVFAQFYGDYFGQIAPKMWEDANELGKRLWRENGVTELGKIRDQNKQPTGLYQHLYKIEKDFWGNRFKVYNKWKDDYFSEYQKKGYIDTLTGFRCSGLMRKNAVTNYPIQGSAFHCCLWTLTKLDEFIIKEDLNSRLLGQIHDAVVLEIAPGERDIITQAINHIATELLPQHWKWIIVPLAVDMEIGDINAPWSQLKKFKLSA